MDDHDDGVKVRTRLELEPECECDENLQGTGLRARAQLCSATQSVKCAVTLLLPSSLASVSLSFLSWFSLLSYCKSSHSFLVAIFHIKFYCI